MSRLCSPRDVSDARVQALVVASSISALAVFGLLGAIAVCFSSCFFACSRVHVVQVSAYHTRGAAPNARLFVRTHVAAYFISLLFCDILQGALRALFSALPQYSGTTAVGSIMSTKWVIEHNVYFGTYCQIQGTRPLYFFLLQSHVGYCTRWYQASV
jgi:hypothetical protein